MALLSGCFMRYEWGRHCRGGGRCIIQMRQCRPGSQCGLWGQEDLGSIPLTETFIWGFFSGKCYVKVKVVQSCPTHCDPMDYTVRGILQARILGWVAFPFSRGSSQPGD